MGRTPEVRVSPLVHAFWEETGIELGAAGMKLWWELPPRSIFQKRERGPVAHAITFVDEITIWVPSLDAWDQFTWLLAVVMPGALMEAEQYGYCHGQAVGLGPIMPVTQFRVTDEAGTYLCVAQALAFEGSVLAYNPTRDEVEWVPVCTLANDLTWAEEKSTVALANYVPCVSQEEAHIVRLGACWLVSWPNDSSTLGEEDEEQGEDEEQEEEQEHGEGEEWEETGPKPLSSDAELEQGGAEEESKPDGQQ